MLIALFPHHECVLPPKQQFVSTMTVQLPLTCSFKGYVCNIDVRHCMKLQEEHEDRRVPQKR
jgi:hypothetical protein